jgi:carbonic anhydrase
MGGVIGSAEFGIEHLQAPVILVLGHTKCGAVSAAVRCCKDGVAACDNFSRSLGAVVSTIRAPAAQAVANDFERNERSGTKAIVEDAIGLNVRHTMEQLIKWSTPIRDALRDGTHELHGAIYDIETGKVEFTGTHPRQAELVAQPEIHHVRTGLDAPMPADEALVQLRLGNERYALGNVEAKLVDQQMRSDLLQKGQIPMAIVLGCADSRVPLDYVFDSNPGDLFVLRNAGSVCGKMTGGLIGSMEYGVDHLKSRLMIVLGHSHCGAVSAALSSVKKNVAMSSVKKKLFKNGGGAEAPPPEGLKQLLALLEAPMKKALEQRQCNS